MLLPYTHAHPTELVSAPSARHVIAAAVLLDCRVTLRTLLRIRRYPVCCLRVILTLLEPLFYQGTGCWLMVAQCTAKAKTVVACAVNGRYNPYKLFRLDTTIHRVYAVRSRTPFETLSVVDVGTGK